MLQVFKNIFGLGPKVDYKLLVQDGAQIIDVRTPSEFNGGHISTSQNIPLDQLKNNLSKLNKSKPVITCCASGMRSASAKSMLNNYGFSEVYNGGGWASLQSKI